MKMLTLNKLIISGDYNKFINDNVIDGKLVFTNLIPKPDNIESQNNNYLIIKYNTDDLLLQFEQSGNRFVCSIDSGHAIAVEGNDYYAWCRSNLGCASTSSDVIIEELSDCAVLYTLTPVASPLDWTWKLKDFYPDLSFHMMSMNETGTFMSVVSTDNAMNIEYISQCFRPEDLYVLDCQILN